MSLPNRVSPNITLAEAIKSQTAQRKNIDNTPTPEHFANMQLLATKVFEPLRAHFNTPIAISSFYRSPKLNKAIGGAANSQHCTGEAMDIDADIFGKINNKQIFDYIRLNLDFDQLIWEFDNPDGTPQWLNVSYKRSGNRKQILKAKKNQRGQTIYEPWKL
jgi:hypothetical protein